MLIGNLPAPELDAAPDELAAAVRVPDLGLGIPAFCCSDSRVALSSSGSDGVLSVLPAFGGVCWTPVDASDDALVFLLGGGGRDDDGFKPVTGAPLAFGGRDTGLPLALAFAFASAFGSGRSLIARNGTSNCSAINQTMSAFSGILSKRGSVSI